MSFTSKQIISIRRTAAKTGVPIEAAFKQAKEIQRNPREYSPKQQAEYFKIQEEQKERRDKETKEAREEFEDVQKFNKRKEGMDKAHPRLSVIKKPFKGNKK